MGDIEIARSVKLKRIEEIAEKAGISKEHLEPYGKYKAKISEEEIKRVKNNKNGKLILVTAMSPTPLGEGKTTISIAIADGLTRLGKNAILALREPSLGPVFGLKGGATGGGRAQVAPMEDINLHFTGDIHAITSANNLLSAVIDNHIYYGNELQIEKVTWKRCVDLNDRQLRTVETGLSAEKNIVPRTDGFDITVASEIMAILCLSEDIEDLKQKLGNIIIGYNKQGQPVYARDLKVEGSMAVLLKDAINPNLVQTLEHTPCIIHGGPFANIAHGCNSIRATKLGMKLADYTITEAGFGADLGAEKFLDIKCRKAQIQPDAVVCVATIKALKFHGGIEKDKILEPNIQALKLGMKNLLRHIDNLKDKFRLNVIVALNKFYTDTNEEIQTVREILEEKNVQLSLVESWKKGSEGAVDISNKLIKLVEETQDFKYAYELEDNIKTKIEKIAYNIYGAKEIELSEEAQEDLKNIERLGYNKLPICFAKTPLSFSDDPKNLNVDKPFKIYVREIKLKAGAGFIVIIAGKIMTMPGLPRVPAAESINIDENGDIVGLF